MKELDSLLYQAELLGMEINSTIEKIRYEEDEANIIFWKDHLYHQYGELDGINREIYLLRQNNKNSENNKNSPT